MCDISRSVLESISTLVAPEIVNYIQLCEFDKQHYFLAMGRRSFYFITKDLYQYIEPPVPYSRIHVCRLDAKKHTLM